MGKKSGEAQVMMSRSCRVVPRVTIVDQEVVECYQEWIGDIGKKGSRNLFQGSSVILVMLSLSTNLSPEDIDINA